MPAIWEAGGGAGPRDDEVKPKGSKSRSFKGVARGFKPALRAEIVDGAIRLLDETTSKALRAAIDAQDTRQPLRRGSNHDNDQVPLKKTGS